MSRIFGSNGPQADFTSGGSVRHYASKFTLSGGDFSVAELHMLVKLSSGGTANFRLQIYDDLADVPNNLICTTGVLTATVGSYTDYGDSVTPVAPVLTDGSPYWLAWQSEDGANDYSETADIGFEHKGTTLGDAFALGSPATFEAINTSGGREFSIWATEVPPPADPTLGMIQPIVKGRFA